MHRETSFLHGETLNMVAEVCFSMEQRHIYTENDRISTEQLYFHAATIYLCGGAVALTGHHRNKIRYDWYTVQYSFRKIHHSPIRQSSVGKIQSNTPGKIILNLVKFWSLVYKVS